MNEVIPTTSAGEVPAQTMLLTLGFAGKTCCNTKIKKDISSRDYFSCLIGDNLSQWQFIKNVFTGRDDIQLTVLDTCADTPFRCLLLALLIRQIRQTLEIRYSKLRILVTPLLHSSFGCGLANDRFNCTQSRNIYLSQAMENIVGKKFSLSCKGNHINVEDITMATKDYTLVLKFDPGITKGWTIGIGSFAFLTPKSLLESCKSDIPCYNKVYHELRKKGVWMNAELSPNVSV